ncbi:UDP-N-acetylmuramoyl-L-alanyl-D-glutamate--2,6-diaminopimelate ligase [Coraliomargarita parva]|uniref:UDP-N-acetylmuramoyl-L-alanyl-D-glutamate--2, 6-diaminopimelate ligase n=1 Tax=Coraliomargarita parva TaxID=3014050 RepID=UPI0022B3417D|nr:UDP-N-acetylmuramoyl-L-alanyl-D-glutamate--2,6-diaminopimelate ligase [Coraliomargarita parva]
MIGLADFQISTLLAAASSRQSYSRRFKSESSRGSGSLNPRLEALVRGLPSKSRKLGSDARVTCLITDSRRVVPGALFFAIGGLRTDGNYYIEEAVDRGAVAIVTEQDLGARFPIDFIQVEDVREALAVVSRSFYDFPDKSLNMIGITGTNGKTTVSMLTQHLIGGQDQVGLIGTIRYDLGRRTLPSFRTTPESVDVYAMLSQMKDNGCKDAVMEISSHGIDQKRIYGMEIEVAAFLNLTQDHIDYHKSMDAYFRAKQGLFQGDAGSLPRKAVINVDCKYGRMLLSGMPTTMEVETFAIDQTADVQAREVQLFANRTEFLLSWPEGQVRVVSPLLGRYNVSNLLAALTIGRARGHKIEAMLERLPTFSSVPGRMERIDCGQDYNVLVDYAHTDDALKHACEMLRELTEGRLIVVFGCGGDRDRSKRAPMLQAVVSGADVVFATSDNPRSEPLDQIFIDMQEGLSSGSDVQFVEDRKRAISLALDAARPGDCVLIAGKGHEAYQEFNGTVIPFDDRHIARELIELKHPELGQG